MGVRAVTIGPEAGFNDLGKGLLYNDSGVAISRGDICYITGGKISATNTDTNEPLRTIAPADADADGGGQGRLVIAAQDISDDSEGWCVDWLWFRTDTSTFSAGDELWLSTTAGGFTNIKPAGGRARKVGLVEQSGTNGLVLLQAVGLPDVPAEGTGALSVGESQVFSVSIAHDDSPADTTIVTVPVGQIWVVDYLSLDLTEVYDGTGADIDVGTTATSNALFDGSADLTDIGVTLERVNKLTPVVIDAASAQDIIVDQTPGTTATTGEATITLKATRIE
jgi:hypothetical protein